MAFYPKFPEDLAMTIEIVTRSLGKDDTYLDAADCPYPDALKAFFRRVASGGVDLTATIDLFEGQEETDVIDKQIQKVLSDLDGMSATMKSAETNEKIAYYKAKTGLLEKLISLKERVFNLKEISQFRGVLMEFMDAVCTKDQISELMKRLDGTLGTEV